MHLSKNHGYAYDADILTTAELGTGSVSNEMNIDKLNYGKH